MIMKNKPLYLILFPLLSFVIALSFPVQIIFLYDIPLNDFSKIFSMLTPVNLISMGTLFLAGGLTLFMHQHIYKIIPALLLILFANNAIVGLYGTDFTLIQVCFSFLLFALSLKPFYKQDIRAVILNPKLRWWKTPTRYSLEKSIALQSAKSKIKTQALNFSTTGLYAKIDSEEELGLLLLNQIIELDIDEEKIKLQAKIVRIINDTSEFPNGVGLEFIKDDIHKNNFIPWLKNEINQEA